MEDEIKEKKKDVVSLILKIFIAIICFMIFITLATHFSLKIDLDNMKKVYPEYDKGYFYYKEDKEVVKIKRIEDIYGNDIKLKINKVPLLYCKDKNCTYINTSRLFERIYLEPKMYISILLVFLFIFIGDIFLSDIFFFCVDFFLLELFFFVSSVFIYINDFFKSLSSLSYVSNIYL